MMPDFPPASINQQPVDLALTGLVFDIRRFSTHDGPGIRTSVFTKGCPLRCKWCQNPEGLELKRKLFYFQDRCIACGTCVSACPQNAISMAGTGDHIIIDRQRCDLCGACVQVCPPMALAFDSRQMTVRDVLEEVIKDWDFYRESGGLTISGGDPFVQKDFNREILKVAKLTGIHTAIETCLFVDRETLLSFLPYLDLLIADFKIFDPAQHQAATGQDNAIIRANFEYLFQEYAKDHPLDILVRIPLIPGFTDSRENLLAIGRYLVGLAPQVKMELLNYNPLAQNKYSRLDMPYAFEKNPRMFTKEEMAGFYAVLREAGVTNLVNG